MTERTSPHAAIIGLGSMGIGMACSIAKSGIRTTGYDVIPASINKFVEIGGLAGKNTAQTANDADILVIVVVNAAQTDEVLFGAGGAAQAMNSGGVIISCATMSPEDACRLAQKSADLGLHYVDAPISGGASKAASGQLTIMASGTEEAFKRARPVLDAMAGTVYELGDRAGIGSSFKMVNQLLAGVHIAAACEAITFAKKLGLDLPTVYKVITASAGNSWMFENRIPHVLEGDYEPRSAIGIFTKDLGIINDMGRKEKFPLNMSATALQMFIATAANGMEQDDDSSVARMIANLTGIELPDSKG